MPLVLSAAALFASGCGKIFQEYNDNPNQLEYGTISPASMMKDVIYYSADGVIYRTWQINGELMQYTVHMYTENIHRYIIRDSYVSGAWNYMAKWAANADHMAWLAERDGNSNMLAVALTMRALMVSDWTDVWGMIPFSDAFEGLGLEGEVNTTPVFDTQEQVYRQLLKDLSRANRLYDFSADKDLIETNNDLLYGGDFRKWQKFTNSLKMRLLMRLSNRNKEIGVSDSLQAMVSDPGSYPVFGSNDDNAVLRYSGVEPFVNRFGATTEKNFASNTRRMAEHLMTSMESLDDPRLGCYAVQTNNEWKGLPSGAPASDMVAGECANLNKDVLGDYTSPYAFMKYDEVQFILAEAAQRKMISGGNTKAREYYESAIEASIRYWDSVNDAYEVTDLAISQFIDKIPYNSTLERIIDQKYIAMFWVGYEAWNDYRRTGYPVLEIGSATDNGGELPTRLVYPISTVSTNNENYKQAVAIQGTDDMHTPVWWSRKAVEQGK